MSIAERKNNHIDICLHGDVRSRITNGFEKYRLIHNALPEADFAAFSAGQIIELRPGCDAGGRGIDLTDHRRSMTAVSVRGICHFPHIHKIIQKPVGIRIIIIQHGQR